MTKYVRKFSSVGPCISQGELVRETESFYFFRDRFDWAAREENREKRIARLKKRGGLVHIEPCPSCTDHPRTQYPNGYEN